MLQKSDKFIKSADKLYDLGDYDSTVSRVYYAMFFIVEALLLTKNIKVKTHSGLISKFGENFIKTEIFSKDLGKRFRKAFDKRLIGDYDYSESIAKVDAEEVLRLGKDFINILKDYLKQLEYNRSN